MPVRGEIVNDFGPFAFWRGTVAFCRSLKSLGRGDQAVEALRTQIGCYGPDHDERRQAALAALIVLRRLDVVAAASETLGDPGPIRVGITRFFHQGRTLFSTIAEAWPTLTEVERNILLSSVRTDQPAGFWIQFARAAVEHPDSHPFVHSAIESHPDIRHTEEVLGFFAAVRSSSRVLRDTCLEILRQPIRRDLDDTQLKRLAAQVYADQFSSERQAIEDELASLHDWEPFQRPGMIAALCAMAPLGSVTRQLYDRLQQASRPPVNVMGYYALTYSCVAVADFVAALARDANYAASRDDQFSLALIAEQVVRRLGRDDGAQGQLLQKLNNQPGEHSKASFPRLLAQASGLDEDTVSLARQMLRSELEAPLSNFGIDLMSAKVGSVAVALLEALDGGLAMPV